MWIDTHAHLFEYQKEQISELISEAASASVEIIISTGTDLQSSAIVVDQCNSFKQIYGAAGISPFDVLNQPDNWLHTLKELLKYPSIIAVGEIGLDSTNPSYPTIEHQLPFFEKQIELACSVDLPAVVHSRGYEKEVVQICRSIGAKRVLFHCFTGDYEAMKTVTDAGYYISFSGILTFKNAGIRKIVSSVPKDRMLIETDSPYLSPVPHRGTKNRPAYLKYTGEELAKLLNMKNEDIQYQLEKNFYTFFFKR